jgi:alpha-mannosidase
MPEHLKPRIYAVATTHLDTSWSWDFETTLRDYLPKTLTENFALFEKYPDYVFSFEGSYRYELMEEYYPELFEKLKEYIATDRWQVAGSAYENGDVNIPSPEALFRNILYGTTYFREKFGKRSEDIYLPDCFGFGWALPSVAAHANLKGFTTQKLIWSSAYEVPFDLGVWQGPDGGQIYASLDAGDYNRSLKTVRKKGSVIRKLKSNIMKYDLPFTFVLHGIGDRGGAPREESVKAVLNEAALNASSKIAVIPATTDQVFRDMDTMLTQEQKAKLPVWNSELVMTDHGVGCYTSRAIGKRWNRRAELLADAAERAAAAAAVLTGCAYPQSVLDTAWKRVIAHQFHDDITGTSLEVCCKRNWNDYILSLNQFAEEYRFAAATVASELDTSFAKGVVLLVGNPVQTQDRRAGTVTAEVFFDEPCGNVSVFDANGEEVPSQTIKKGAKSHHIAFSARVPSIGYAAYDVRPSAIPSVFTSDLKVTQRTLENAKYRVTLDENGDIAQIVDKVLKKELLSKPIRMALHDYDGAGTYPAWELEYKEVMAPPREYAAKPDFSIVENGPARIAIQTVRHAAGSRFKQIVSLDSHGETVNVFNEIDWRSLRSLLKTEFPLTAANKKATYDLGLGVIERGNSKPSLYEVPAQNWADITNTDGRFGISVFSDSKVGWDKPDDNTLRLTGIHSPRGAYRDAQHLLEFGLNRYSFAIYSHAGSWQNGTQQAAMEFVQPLTSFAVPASPGRLGSEYSFCRVSDNAIIIRAIKKAQDSDEIIVRVNEGEGKSHADVRLQIGDGITAAREVWATEEPKGDARVENGELVFDIGAFEPKTFALSVKSAAEKMCRYESGSD